MVLSNIRCRRASPCTVADVEYIDLLLFLQNTIDHSIEMRPAAIEKVPKLFVLRRRWAAVRKRLKAENGFFKPCVPFERRRRVPGVQLIVERGKVSLGADGDINEIGHDGSRTR